MTKVLCFGSLNIDYVYQVDHFVQKGETLQSQGLNVYTGGKGLNQSVALSRAGCKTFHAGMIGEDGRFLLDVLAKSKVDISRIAISGQVRTGNAIIQNNKEGDNCIMLYAGANHQITEEMADAALADFGEGDYLVVQNEINCLSYIIQAAKKKGLVIVLNPSPVDENLTEENLQLVDYLVLNEIEASALTGYQSERVEGLAAALQNKYPHSRCVLTLGDKGSCYIDGDIRIHQKIFPMAVKDTTAAGDTFLGYFVASLLQGRDIAGSLRRASKAASIAISRVGAAPSIPWGREVSD